MYELIEEGAKLLLHEYEDDQPRDEHGMWTTTGGLGKAYADRNGGKSHKVVDQAEKQILARGGIHPDVANAQRLNGIEVKSGLGSVEHGTVTGMYDRDSKVIRVGNNSPRTLHHEYAHHLENGYLAWHADKNLVAAAEKGMSEELIHARGELADKLKVPNAFTPKKMKELAASGKLGSVKLTRAISPYALMDHNEWRAEAFAAYHGSDKEHLALKTNNPKTFAYIKALTSGGFNKK